MPYDPVDDLRQEIEEGRVLVVVGTGVSLAATGSESVASWQGLLKDGVERCQGLRNLSGPEAIRAIEGREQVIVHLHGHWANLDSVILDRESYDRIRQHDLAQTVLRGLRTFKTLLFVGCGDGLADPNFGALLEWARVAFRNMEGRHYRLCLESEVSTLRALHRDDHILPVSYGPSYGDLAPFLRTLRATGTKPVSKPRLPGRPTRCFGRTDELRDLVETLLLPSPLPVPILGPPGVGKTTVSLEALHESRVTARFSDRRFFVRCDGAKNRDALVTEIALSLGLESGPDLERRLLQALESSPAVLLLDNAETPWDADTVPVENLLAELSTISGVALVASIRGDQRPLGPRWKEAIRIGPFGLPAARETFVDIAGARFQSDPDLDRLLEAIDRLPIAVVLLAHQAEAEPHLASLWKRWQEKRTALLRNADGKERLTNIEVSLDPSLDGPRMTAEARRLLSVLALLPDGVAHEDLDALMPGEAAAVLRKVGLGFDQGTRLRVLAPIREYVSRQHPPEEEDLARAMGHYLKLARKGDLVGRKGGAEVVARLVQELGNLDAMVSKGLERDDPDLAILAAVDLGKFSWLSGWGSGDLLNRAVGIARTSGRQALEAQCAGWLGDIALERSEVAAAGTDSAKPSVSTRGFRNLIRLVGPTAAWPGWKRWARRSAGAMCERLGRLGRASRGRISWRN
jgi:hypothetical protein